MKRIIFNRDKYEFNIEQGGSTDQRSKKHSATVEQLENNKVWGKEGQMLIAVRRHSTENRDDCWHS